jgi:hypothetical protein
VIDCGLELGVGELGMFGAVWILIGGGIGRGGDGKSIYGCSTVIIALLFLVGEGDDEKVKYKILIRDSLSILNTAC